MAFGVSAHTAVSEPHRGSEHVHTPLSDRAIQRALDEGRFVLWFQPIVCLRTLDVRSFEGLARLRSDDGEVLSPAHFIDVIEADAALYERFTDQMIGQAVAFAANCESQGLDVQVSVNLADASLRDAGLVERIGSTLASHSIAATRLGFEITEREFIEPTPTQRVSLRRLSELGIGLAIDDFGTGWSSLETLRWLPVSQLKIDRCFLEHITQHSTDRIIVDKVIDLAHSLHLTTIAEGIESNRQLELLRAIGCDRGQGFLFSPAVPAHEAIELARTGVPALTAPPDAMAARSSSGATASASSGPFRLDADVACVSEALGDGPGLGGLGLQMLDMVPMAVFIKSLDGRIVWCNEAYWRRLGVTSLTEVLGQRDLDLHRVDDALHYRRVDLAVMMTATPVVDRRESQERGAEHVTLRTSKYPVLSRSGTVVGLIGFYVEAGVEARRWLDRDLDRLASAAKGCALLFGSGDAGAA